MQHELTSLTYTVDRRKFLTIFHDNLVIELCIQYTYYILQKLVVAKSLMLHVSISTLSIPTIKWRISQ